MLEHNTVSREDVAPEETASSQPAIDVTVDTGGTGDLHPKTGELKESPDSIFNEVFTIAVNHLAKNNLKNEPPEVATRRLTLVANYLLMVKALLSNNSAVAASKSVAVMRACAANPDDMKWLGELVRQLDIMFVLGEKVKSGVITLLTKAGVNEKAATLFATIVTFPAGMYSHLPMAMVNVVADLLTRPEAQAANDDIENYLAGFKPEEKAFLLENYENTLEAILDGKTGRALWETVKAQVANSALGILTLEHDQVVATLEATTAANNDTAKTK